jgi:PAS domain S-box-containing protein
LVRLGLPTRWPSSRGLAPPPYVSSLNRKLLFPLIPLFGLGILLLFWANITMATLVSTRLVVDQMANAADTASRGIPFFIETGQNLIGNIAGQADLLSPDPQVQRASLSRSLRAVPYFRQLTLLDSRLVPIAGYPAGPADLPALRNEEKQLAGLALAGIPQNTTVYSDAPGDAVDVVFAAPVPGAAGGGPAAVVVGRASLSDSPLMQSVTSNLVGLASGLGQGFIVDEYGVIIYHPDPARILDTFTPETSARPLATRLAGASAYQDKAPDGTRRLVLFYPVPGHPWSVVVVVPNHVVLSLAAQISTPIVLILFLIGAMGILIVSLIAVRVTRPAEALALAAQRISEGQLDRPVAVQGEDEIGRAGLAFERMREKLRARLEELGMLLRVSQNVASSLNLDDALPPILQGALAATGAAGARIVLMPPEEGPALDGLPVYPVYCAGAAAPLMAPLDRGVLALTREEGRAIIENLARARAVLDVAAVAGRLQAVMALPLRLEPTFHGALWLAYDTPHTFGEAEINFLTTLAGQAAVSVANARLFEAAEQGRQRLAAILASTPDAVVVTDRSERVLLLNPAAEAAFDLAGKATVGRPVAQVLPDPELVKLLQTNHGSPPSAAGEFKLSTGRTLYASASTIIGADGGALGRVCVLRDVTHFKELDEMKSEFVATVSHDLRAPLTFMRGYATMLPMVGVLNERQRDFSEKIVAGIEQMTVLIDDLLDLGRIEAGVDLAREPVRIEQVVGEVVETLAPHAANKKLRLQVDLPPGLPTLSGDATLLRQAVTNLVDNAIKYTPSGGEVRLRVALDGGHVLFAASDTGVGIAPADQAHLFDKFFRVKQRGPTQVKGSGLGLAIVRSIVERHGGRVWVESKLGKGSTFYVKLPVDLRTS